MYSLDFYPKMLAVLSTDQIYGNILLDG